MKKSVLLHYGELSLKQKNRSFFEGKLLKNIRKTFSKSKLSFATHSGRFIFPYPEDLSEQELVQKLSTIFGLYSFALIIETPKDVDHFIEVLLEELSRTPFETFGVHCKRADKRFPFNSQEFAGKLGELIQDKFHKKVDLETPDLWVHVEILQRVFCFHFKSYPGLKGLPVGVSGRSCCLLSGGIDSPVASLKMMSRGSSQVFVHFHSFPMTTGESLEKVQALVQLLSQYQGNSPLYLVPFAEIQKEIVAQCRESLRILLYRRLMVRVAEVIAKKESALALVTGESLGQVASQTLVNMTAIGQAIELPILRPLLTYSKEEIIREARLFKTFEISTRPHEDCCTFLMPKNPSTNSPHSVLSRAEENFPMVQWLEHLVKSSEFKMIYPQTSS